MDIIKTLQKNKSGPVRMLDEISTCLPGNVWLTKLDQKGTKLQLKAWALITFQFHATWCNWRARRV